jgi:hypothetical protein
MVVSGRKIPIYDSGTQALGVVFSHGGELNKEFPLITAAPRRLASSFLMAVS